MCDQEGRVTHHSWSEVQNASGKLADVQGYALLQLEGIARKLESKKRVGGIATASEEAKPEVQKWLAVLADCFRLQESFDVLALDIAMDEEEQGIPGRTRATVNGPCARKAAVPACISEILVGAMRGRARRWAQGGPTQARPPVAPRRSHRRPLP